MRALLAVLFLSAIPAAAQAAPALLRASLAHSLLRVQPQQTPPTAQRIRLSAARNEWAGFQVIVTADAGNLQEVNIAAAPLKGPRGAALPAPRLYREHYVQVTKPTYRAKEPPGWWPDALIPFDIPADERLPGKPRFAAAPFDVEAGRNQPIYAEVYVPEKARPGEYRGEVTVTARGQKPQRLAVSLTVWDFALPASPACQSNFGGFWRVAQHEGLRDASPEARALVRRYERALIAHRLMPGMPDGAYPNAAPDGTPDCAPVEPILREYFEMLHGNALQIPLPVGDPTGKGREAALRYLRGYYDFLAIRGWADRGYTYLIDEPNDAKAYEEVRRLAKLVHEANPKIRFLCTEQPIPDNPAWGTLIGAVDLWCPLWALWDDNSIRARLKAGEQVWSYTALCQGKEETPFWELDFPLLNYRIASWQDWITGCTGLLYWTTVYWEKAGDPWTNPQTYGEGNAPFNGEGMLFYPGKDAGINGPVASLRLKAIRDGMQDYDYCALLAAKRGREQADAIVRQVARSWTDWQKDPQAIIAAREKLARAIMGK
jgi:hypothetical protein